MPAQPWILLTNDDGVDSPALAPLADELSTIASVRVVVPDRERSWVGKAMSRFEPVTVAERQVGQHRVYTVSGYPADCTQLGARSLFDGPPALVVSGINIGANHGTSYVSASGTVGAAVEAAMVQIPALAFSAVRDGDWQVWSRHMSSPDSVPDWIRLAAVAADLTAEVWTNGMPAGVDVLSVNIPGRADRGTPRRVTRLADSRHGTLFTERDGHWIHGGVAGLRPLDVADDTDMATSEAGVVSVTPLRVAALGAGVTDDLRRRFDRSGDEV
ncbi:MAG: 5'/3'-nucleotidase SurE [Acidimicrobiia bacterium]|nr:5'/3'-nucleotidase SurE [Acidimicrobiia bacterium]